MTVTQRQKASVMHLRKRVMVSSVCILRIFHSRNTLLYSTEVRLFISSSCYLHTVETTSSWKHFNFLFYNCLLLCCSSMSHLSQIHIYLRLHHMGRKGIYFVMANKGWTWRAAMQKSLHNFCAVRSGVFFYLNVKNSYYF